MMTPNYFKIDYERLLVLLLPVRARAHSLLMLLWCCVKPLADTYNMMKTGIDAFFQQRNYNTTVVALKAMLDKKFIEERGYRTDKKDCLFDVLDFEVLTNATLRQERETNNTFVLRTKDEKGHTVNLYKPSERNYCNNFVVEVPDKTWAMGASVAESNLITLEEVTECLQPYLPLGFRMLIRYKIC